MNNIAILHQRPSQGAHPPGPHSIKVFGVLLILFASQITSLHATSGGHFYVVTGTADTTDSAKHGGDGLSPGTAWQMSSLRGAVIAANSDPGATITVPAGTYRLTIASVTSEINEIQDSASGDLDILANNVSIQGAGAALTVIQQTMANQAVLDVNPNGDPNFNFTVSGVTITGGESDIGGGGIIAASSPGSTVAASNCIFSNNQASGSLGFSGVGGAIAQTGGNLVLTSCTFNGNSSGVSSFPGGGGAIYFDATTAQGAGNLTVTNCSFSNNSATSSSSGGGAIELVGGANTITGCFFTSNLATACNGGAVIVDSGTATMTACTFVGNSVTSAGHGGAVENSNVGHVTLNFCRFVNNAATIAANGGAVHQTALTSGSINAEENWWGSNNGPASNDAVGTTVHRYLKLEISAIPVSIPAGTTATVTADFLMDSGTVGVSAASLGAFAGLPVTFTPTGGLISNAQTIQSNGAATASFTAGAAPGAATVTAQVDNPPVVTANLTITAPDLIVTNTDSGNFRQGDSGDSYTITVKNSGNASTNGLVALADTLPAGLTLTGSSGTGWTITATGPVVTATRSDALAANASYPPITLTVNVSNDAPASVTNTATVSGGGETNTSNNTASDLTNIAPAPATHFSVSAPASATAGVAFNFTVTALNQFGGTASGYSGTVQFNSTDTAASLPLNATLSNGVGAFSATLKTSASQTVTATDTVTASINGTSNTIALSAAAASHLVVSAPASSTAGGAFSFTVTALDQFNNIANGYAGTAHFTSTDGAAALPANSTLTNGVGTFSATLKTSASQTIVATDTVTSSITGTSNSIMVNPAAVTHLSVSAPGNATAGSAFNFTVTAQDQFNNTATGYAGTAHFTSNDGAAVLPANATLTNGAGTFSATLKTSGNRTITATDTVTSSIAGASSAIAVSAGVATQLSVSAPANATAGGAFNFTVTAMDQFSNTAAGYSGTIHFTSSDSPAVVPADSTLTAGTGTFSATLKTVGNSTITATDKVNSSITGTSNTVAVTTGAATHLGVSAPANATAGGVFNFTVTALDQFNNTANRYSGAAHFTSTDGAAVLPSNSTLANGVGTFSATLKTSGNRTITATDTVTSSITGSSDTIAVSAGAATHVSVSAPANATAGSRFNFTVTAFDPFENVVPFYSGTLAFMSTDGKATLPGNNTLLNGSGTFNATLKTAGLHQQISAIDVTTNSITGNSGDIAVAPAAASRFVVAAPGAAIWGTGFTFTVAAQDPFSNTTTAYGGSIHFTSTDNQAVLPSDSLLTGGTGTFKATFRTLSGSATIAVVDTGSSSIAGTSNVVAVSGFPPVAVDDTAFTTGTTSVIVRVLANDTDPNGGTLRITQVTRARFGTTTVNPDGTITYTPHVRLVLGDSFEYVISNGFGLARAKVTVSDLYAAGAGSYDGLFTQGSVVPTDSILGKAGSYQRAYSGYLKAVVGTTGGFTGTLKVAGGSYPIQGTFSSSGGISLIIPRLGGLHALALDLKLDPANRQIGGTLDDGTLRYSVSAGHQVPAGNLAGKYTVVFEATGIDSSRYAMLRAVILTGSTIPQGDGFGFITVDGTGNVTVTGTLADGSAISSTSFLKADYTFPIYNSLYGPLLSQLGNFAGIVVFQDVPNISDAHGSVTWVKPAIANAASYPMGFGTIVDAVVSRYQAPVANSAALNWFQGQGRAILNEGDMPLGSSVTRAIVLDSTNKITVTNSGIDKLAITVRSSDGFFQGTFIDPGSQRLTLLSGVLLQKQQAAGGFFLSGGKSGLVELGQNAR